MRVFEDLPDLVSAVGTDLGYSDWTTVDQARIDAFAQVTEDQQWIHTDIERAAAGPYGATIAHGMLTLSLVPGLLRELYAVRGLRMGINYGFDKVRFISVVPVGSKVRLGASLAAATPVHGGVQVVWQATIEREGSDKPACVAQFVVRLVE